MNTDSFALGCGFAGGIETSMNIGLFRNEQSLICNHLDRSPQPSVIPMCIATADSHSLVPILTCTAFTLVYAANPASPNSLPIPLCFTPPNGIR